MKKELLFVLETRVADIREWKQEQWRYFYTALIALVGLLASIRVPSTTMHGPAGFYKLLVVIACAVISYLWWYANKSTEDALRRTREALRKGYDLLNEEVRSTRPSDMRKNATVPLALRWAVFAVAIFVVLSAIAT